MIERDLADKVKTAAASFPAVTLTGPRQSGKSTLCRAVFPDLAHINLEEPDVRSFALRDPRGFLAQYPHGAIIDEVQRCPQLPSYLQVIIDDDPSPGRWILTGSQNLALLESVSQSLAGRTAVLHLLPLARDEVRRFDTYPSDLDEAMLAGGYPRIFDRGLSPAEWLGAYVGTYIERDVRTITTVGDLVTFQRFVELCAGRTGQLLNVSALAADAGVAQPTAKAWLSVLETSFITFRLPALYANIRKRLVKMPKLHFYDTGLVCWLLGIRNTDQLRAHPLRGGHLRDVGGLRDRQAPHQRGRASRRFLLPRPARHRSGPGRRDSRRPRLGRGQGRPDRLGRYAAHRTSYKLCSETRRPMPRNRGLRRPNATTEARRPPPAMGRNRPRAVGTVSRTAASRTASPQQKRGHSCVHSLRHNRFPMFYRGNPGWKSSECGTKSCSPGTDLA